MQLSLQVDANGRAPADRDGHALPLYGDLYAPREGPGEEPDPEAPQEEQERLLDPLARFKAPAPGVKQGSAGTSRHP